MELKAYVFNTQGEALTAVGIVNAALGIPKQGGVTETYFIPQQNPTDSRWYVLSDDVTDMYLSNPVTITVPDQTMSGWN